MFLRKEIGMTRPSAKNTFPTNGKHRSRLPAALEKHLAAYAVAAGSAGVALLACVHPAEARVVSTKTDIIVPFRGPVQIDLDNDGQFDFSLSNVNFKTQTAGAGRRPGAPPLGSGSFDVGLQLSPLHDGNEGIQLGTHYGNLCAAAVPRGAQIGQGRPFVAGKLVLSGLSGTSEGRAFCNWSTGDSPFLGVRFMDAQGQPHYGWVRISIRMDYSTVIKAYAYETTPNTPITAGTLGGPAPKARLAEPPHLAMPEPASLGYLALGANGLAAWRRDDENIVA
jgi:hypothetical protein